MLQKEQYGAFYRLKSAQGAQTFQNHGILWRKCEFHDSIEKFRGVWERFVRRIAYDCSKYIEGWICKVEFYDAEKKCGKMFGF